MMQNNLFSLGEKHAALSSSEKVLFILARANLSNTFSVQQNKIKKSFNYSVTEILNHAKMKKESFAYATIRASPFLCLFIEKLQHVKAKSSKTPA